MNPTIQEDAMTVSPHVAQAAASTRTEAEVRLERERKAAAKAAGNFIGRDGKEYRHAMVLGRMTLCEVMKPKLQVQND